MTRLVHEGNETPLSPSLFLIASQSCFTHAATSASSRSLAWTAGRMIVHDPFVHGLLTPYPLLDAVLPSLGVFAVVAAGYWATLKQRAGKRSGTDQPK